MLLRIDLSRCLRNWNKHSKCRECIAACKFNALKVGESRGIEIDETRCVACGSCVSACPVSVFDLGVDELIEKTVEKKRPGAIVISCRENLKTEEDVFHSLRLCINALKVEHYLLMLDSYDKIYIDARCDECPWRGKGVDIIDRLLEIVSNREDLAKKLVVLRGVEETFYPVREEFKVLAIDLAEIAIQLHGIPLAELYGGSRGMDNKRLRKFTPRIRLEASEVARRRNLEIRVKGPEIIEDKCNLCRICEDICPTNAISVNERSGVIAISYSRCIECLHCIDLCPYKALYPDLKLIYDIRLGYVENRICETCGRAYNKKLEECPYCKASKDLENYVRKLFT
ncbi:MAG: 4Fe-4S binding protein [Sulfolobales archaeon]